MYHDTRLKDIEVSQFMFIRYMYIFFNIFSLSKGKFNARNSCVLLFNPICTSIHS